MNNKGYEFSPDQVSGRQKTLVRAYKNVKDSNNKSGSKRRVFQFEQEFDDLFHKDPTIEPEVTLSSSGPAKKGPASENEDEKLDLINPSQCSTSKEPKPKKKTSFQIQ